MTFVVLGVILMLMEFARLFALFGANDARLSPILTLGPPLGFLLLGLTHAPRADRPAIFAFSIAMLFSLNREFIGLGGWSSGIAIVACLVTCYLGARRVSAGPIQRGVVWLLVGILVSAVTLGIIILLPPL